MMRFSMAVKTLTNGDDDGPPGNEAEDEAEDEAESLGGFTAGTAAAPLPFGILREEKRGRQRWRTRDAKQPRGREALEG